MIDEFFRSFDDEFSAAGTGPQKYQSSEVLVQTQLDLTVPVVAGTEVQIEFTTRNGDISFSMHFSAWSTDEEGGSLEPVCEPTRVPSDVAPHRETFRAPCDGNLLLLFDNSYSWFTLKYLSYQVDAVPPSTRDVEMSRCFKAQQLLASAVGDIHVAEDRLTRAKDRMLVLKGEVAALEERAARLRAELAARQAQLDKAYEEADEMSARIDAGQDKAPGLCIRTLNRPLLENVLQFLPPSTTAPVCKYWALISSSTKQSR